MSSEYEQARRGAEKRRRAARLEMRARSLLTHAGWSATEEELHTAADERVVQKGLRPAVVEAALALQKAERARERRIDVTEIGATMTRKLMPAETAQRIREHVTARRAEDPKLTADRLRAEVNDRFGVQIEQGNFYITYWPGLKKKARAAARPAPRAAPASNTGQRQRRRGSLGKAAAAVTVPRPAALRSAAPVPQRSIDDVVRAAVRRVTVLNPQRLQVVIEFDVAELLELARANGATT